MFIKAIHTIMRANDAKPPVLYPNGIAEMEGAELESMLALNAVVEATEDEIALAGFVTSAAADKAAAEQAAAEQAAADKAAAEQAAADKAAADKAAAEKAPSKAKKTSDDSLV
ncbi:hypothetical protein [Mesorhizobium sp.]|uniref:hypothetical protein n=1 Tax=Mesorhizobium sp. TaxID=1871066 RepID=UPI000FE5D520|nr:hypothetical protein [Mesorhizobium sp.]RWP69578.1 MAG: hypothetical protein EOR07_03370 [Mesorhizobium sp.]